MSATQNQNIKTGSELATEKNTAIPSTAEIIPFQVIRTETAFSKYPIHNLAKRGDIDIDILEKGEKGEAKLKWQVSYNKRYGEARQLAYKMDTLLVNRKLDEAGRPLPKIIRLG